MDRTGGRTSKREFPSMSTGPFSETGCSRPCLAAGTPSYKRNLVGDGPPDVQEHVVDEENGPRPDGDDSEDQLEWLG